MFKWPGILVGIWLLILLIEITYCGYLFIFSAIKNW